MVYLSKENIDSELWTSFDISDDFIVSHCAYFINKNGNELQISYSGGIYPSLDDLQLVMDYYKAHFTFITLQFHYQHSVVNEQLNCPDHFEITVYICCRKD